MIKVPLEVGEKNIEKNVRQTARNTLYYHSDHQLKTLEKVERKILSCTLKCSYTLLSRM